MKKEQTIELLKKVLDKTNLICKSFLEKNDIKFEIVAFTEGGGEEIAIIENEYVAFLM